MFDNSLEPNPLGLTRTSSYFQHDGIDVLFSAQDLAGREYLGSLVEESDTSATFLISKLPTGVLDKLEAGRLDLRSAQLSGSHVMLTRTWSEVPLWSSIELADPPGPELLPEPGLLLRNPA